MSNVKSQISNVSIRGFTLIELIVVLVLLVSGSVAGIASFSRFQKTKALDVSAAEVESFLNSARINAVTQTFPQPPITCVHPMQRYSVRIIANDVYEMDVYCSGVRSAIKTKRLINGVTFALVPNEISFLAASGTSPIGGVITLNGVYGSKQIIIDTGGNITKQ